MNPEDQTDLLFVYGTLREKGSNGWRMKSAPLIGEGWVYGILLDIGSFPGLILGGTEKVIGEVRQIQVRDLPALDAYEDDAYRRIRLQVKLPDRTLEAWAYEWLEDRDAFPKIAGGDWLAVEGSGNS